MKSYRIACVPGDGIGREIVTEGMRVLDAAASAGGFALDFDTFPYGAGHYKETGAFMPEDGIATLQDYDAIYFGAVGLPDVDDTLPAKDFTFKVRTSFRQYVNYRPVRLLPGMPSPLRGSADREIDFVIVRENTQGEFVQAGKILNFDQPDAVAVDTSIFTRVGTERIARYAFRLAQSRRGLVTNVTKSNTLINSLLFWDRIVAEVAEEFPEVTYEKMYVDNASANFVLRPERFDVVLTTNMIGDILSDLGAALMGSLGLAPSGNINPEKEYPSMFEPIHGSAPDIVGKGIANPVSAIGSGALMLRHLGETEAADRMDAAIAAAIGDGVLTPDLGGRATTSEMTDAVLDRLNA